MRIGDVDAAWATARELGRVSLDHALALVVLASGDRDRGERFNAAAARWALRYLGLTQRPGFDDLRALVAALDQLPDLDAITTLGALSDELSLVVASSALDHLLPAHP